MTHFPRLCTRPIHVYSATHGTHTYVFPQAYASLWFVFSTISLRILPFAWYSVDDTHGTTSYALTIILVVSALVDTDHSYSLYVFSSETECTSTLFTIASPPPPNISLVITITLITHIRTLAHTSSDTRVSFSESVPHLDRSLIIIYRCLLRTILYVSPTSTSLDHLTSTARAQFASTQFPHLTFSVSPYITNVQCKLAFFFFTVSMPPVFVPPRLIRVLPRLHTMLLRSSVHSGVSECFYTVTTAYATSRTTTATHSLVFITGRKLTHVLCQAHPRGVLDTSSASSISYQDSSASSRVATRPSYKL